MMIAFTGLCALLPSLLLVYYFYVRDVYREPGDVLVRTFLLGVVSFLPVVAMGYALLWLGQGIRDPLMTGLYMGFVCVALPEELFKFLVVTLYCARHPAFDEPMDGVVYGATAALGFATLENVLYVIGSGWPVALTRAFTAVPMHASLGAILGYYVGQAKFGSGKARLIWVGLLAAVLLHGLYDFPLLIKSQILFYQGTAGVADAGFLVWPLVVSLAVLAFGVAWTLRIVRRLRHDQLETVQASSAALPEPEGPKRRAAGKRHRRRGPGRNRRNRP
ncbi:MAG: PrsW family glutamic-type intramembrane protease [Planctomycetota bacterium]|jgi:RsiW-degrading membrane proteinase PrsW (M82 family)